MNALYGNSFLGGVSSHSLEFGLDAVVLIGTSGGCEALTFASDLPFRERCPSEELHGFEFNEGLREDIY